jgi:hypothetical protein
VGIVDPFLQQNVKPGEHFWLVVYPRQITSLRHVWTHPAFDSKPEPMDASSPKALSEVWLRDYAATLREDYSKMLERTHEYLENDDYWSEGEKFEGERLPDEYWDHYQNVTGRMIPSDQRYSFFSCSC